MNAVATNCQIIADQLEAYLDHKLDADAAAAVEAHLEVCSDCHECIQYSRAVHGLLEYIQIDPRAALREEEPEVGFFAKLQSAVSAAPWWGVSVALHALVMLLAGLLSMTVKLPPADDCVIMVTELQQRELGPEVKQDLARSDAALESKLPVNATDPVSKEQSNIVVPQDILQRAELGDHFETVNPDRPDTQSAFGNADAEMFHSVRGDDDAAGGGGDNGGFLETLIGVGGGAGVGTGGGFGGGDGTGIGLGKGSGTGSFGNRNGGGRKLMVKKHGGSRATEGAVDAALYWLASHQEGDGHWDCQKYEGHNEPRCIGINGDAAVTGFAVLAFLGAGHTDRVGQYKDNVKRGLAWLCIKLDENEKSAGHGRWCKNHGSNYTQGVAALALAEAAGMNPGNKELRAYAQRAIDGVIAGQIKLGPSDYQAWDYQPGTLVNDTSITGWNIMALKSAKIAGLHVDTQAFVGAMTWIEAGQDLKDAPGVGAAEYWEGGRMAYRGTLDAPNRGQGSTAMMSAATLTRLMVGGEKPDMPGIAGPCNLMKKPGFLPDKWPGNLYYWYYATLTMFQKGGEHWTAWNEPLKKTLVDAQRKDGDMHGSWDPLMGSEHGYIWGGRVMSTSLGALCLEVYYRYAQLNRQ